MSKLEPLTEAANKATTYPIILYGRITHFASKVAYKVSETAGVESIDVRQERSPSEALSLGFLGESLTDTTQRLKRDPQHGGNHVLG